MTGLFNGATSFNQDIGSWDVSGVNVLDYMFTNASSFNQDIGSWNVDGVWSMYVMFSGATSFDYPLCDWEPSSQYIYLPPNWSTDSMDATIIGWYLNWDSIPSNRYIYYGNQYCHSADTINLLDSQNNWNFYSSGGLNCSSSSSSLDEIISTCASAGAFTPITDNNIHAAVDLWDSYENVAMIEYGHIEDWDVSNVTIMSQVFSGHTNLNEDLSLWDVSNVTNMYYMFSGASSFNGDISSWDVSSATNMTGMFYGATSFNQDIGSWDVSNVTNMTFMFRNASSFNQDIGLSLIHI